MLIHFDFEIRTADGHVIADGIPARGELAGAYCPAEPDVGSMSPWYEDLTLSDVQVDVGSFDVSLRKHVAKWIDLPAELKPFLDRWLRANDDVLAEQMVQEAA